MDMVNMKMSKQESTEAVSPSKQDGPRYPWGLNIGLENDVLDKLGMDTLPKVGDVVMVTAMAKIESVSMSENSDKTKNRRVQMQITDMSVEPKKPDVQKSLYGA
jgi:hypothetical protein